MHCSQRARKREPRLPRAASLSQRAECGEDMAPEAVPLHASSFSFRLEPRQPDLCAIGYAFLFRKFFLGVSYHADDIPAERPPPPPPRAPRVWWTVS